MKKLLFYLLLLGFSIHIYGQTEEKLREVVIRATNYKYLNKVDLASAAIPVALLQEKAAAFNVKDSEYYSDFYDTYEVTFYIPDGYILAAYDKNGEILRTVEKYKDITLPMDVVKAIAKKYPNWAFKKDVYLVSYHEDKGVNKKYKITLENGDKKIKVTTDEKGNFI